MPFGNNKQELKIATADAGCPSFQVNSEECRPGDGAEEDDDTTRGLAEGQFPELYSPTTKAMSSTIKMEDLF